MKSYSGYGARRMLRNLICAIVITLGGTAAAQTVTVAALGDSLTQGYGLVQEDGLVPQLERWLQAQGADVRVVNAGVSGDTTQGGLSRIDWTLTPDVDAVMVALGGNDLLRGIDPAVSRANIEGIVTAARKADVDVLLVGIDAPLNYGEDYKNQFDAIFPEVAQAQGVAYHAGFFEAFEGMDILNVMQADGIHPNAEGVALIVREIGPSVLELVQN